MMICNKEAEIEFTQVQTKLSLRGQGFQVITILCIRSQLIFVCFYILSTCSTNLIFGKYIC